MVRHGLLRDPDVVYPHYAYAICLTDQDRVRGCRERPCLFPRAGRPYRQQLLVRHYYGDAWSSLADFESTLARVREIDARWYATFHHIGVVEGRPAFLERLDRFAAVIGTRETRLLEFLAEPRSVGEIVAHRFVYRPGDAVPFADDVERRSMTQHLARLQEQGQVAEVEAGRYRARPISSRSGPE